MREIVFDTETTGIGPEYGHRLVEIGCIELVNRVETGRTFQAYFNPERDMPAEAEAVHGLSARFLADKPCFHVNVQDLIDFLGDSPLIAHNAGFDFGFLNHELTLCGREGVALSRMIDTVAMARARHPGAKHSLDALCTRYGIDRSHRIKHGALLDAQLLSQLYVELTGGRQIGFALAAEPVSAADGVRDPQFAIPAARPIRPVRPHAASDAERARHAAFLGTLTDPLWTRLQQAGPAAVH